MLVHLDALSLRPKTTTIGCQRGAARLATHCCVGCLGPLPSLVVKEAWFLLSRCAGSNANTDSAIVHQGDPVSFITIKDCKDHLKMISRIPIFCVSTHVFVLFYKPLSKHQCSIQCSRNYTLGGWIFGLKKKQLYRRFH